MTALVVEALHTAVPLRRCTQRLGRNYTAPLGAPVCSAAQLGVAHCPCSGTADPGEYAAAVQMAERAMTGDPIFTVDALRDRMTRLAHQQRFEEAAMTRDRLSALLGAVRRTSLLRALGELGSAEITLDTTTWLIADGHLVDVRTDSTLTAALPVQSLGTVEPGTPVAREHVDEALCLAKYFDRHAARLSVSTTGTWSFPIASHERIDPIHHAA